MKIRLGTTDGCLRLDECAATASGLHQQLATGRYDWPASLLHLEDFNGWHAQHRTARKRAARASILGYHARRIERSQHVDEIHAINTSKLIRQGRPMATAYLELPTFSPLPAYPCRRHRIDQWGVFTADGLLVGYMVTYVSGDLLMISQILGHGDHEPAGIMYLLAAAALRESPAPATVFYNRHDSGTDGLRFLKERLGFTAERAEWCL